MYTWSAFFSFKGNLFMRKWRLYMLSRFFLGGNSSKVSYSSIAFSNVFAKNKKKKIWLIAKEYYSCKDILFLDQQTYVSTWVRERKMEEIHSKFKMELKFIKSGRTKCHLQTHIHSYIDIQLCMYFVYFEGVCFCVSRRRI